MKHTLKLILLLFTFLIPMQLHAFSIRTLVAKYPEYAVAGTAAATVATVASIAVYCGLQHKITNSYKTLERHALDKQYTEALAIYHNKHKLSDVALFDLIDSYILSCDVEDIIYKKYLKKLRSDLRTVRFNGFFVNLSSGNERFKNIIDNHKKKLANLEAFIRKAQQYKIDRALINSKYEEYKLWIERSQYEEDVASIIRTAILATGKTNQPFLYFDKHLAKDLRTLRRIQDKTPVQELKKKIDALLNELGNLRKALHSTYEYKEERREHFKREKLNNQQWLLLDYTLSHYRHTPIIL